MFTEWVQLGNNLHLCNTVVNPVLTFEFILTTFCTRGPGSDILYRNKSWTNGAFRLAPDRYAVS